MNKYLKISLLVLAVLLTGLVVITATFPRYRGSFQGFIEKITKQQVYRNEKYGLEIRYPKDFKIEENQNGAFFNELNLYSLSINAPSNYQENTDFNIARINILVSPSTTNCYTLSPSNGVLSAVKVINGRSFHYDPKQPLDDSAAGGQRGFDSWFATIENGQCYRIEKLIGYRDERGFVDPPYPAHFDEQKVNADLDKIITTLKIN